MGTLTPSGGNSNGNYGTADTEAARQRINTWIRTNTADDGFIDFDATVRDPNDMTRIDPQYDGGDHLHFNLAGYKTMGEAVPLDQLALPRCRRSSRSPRLHLKVNPTRLTAGRRATLRVRVRAAGHPVQSAAVTIGRVSARTNRRGLARLHVRLARPGRRTIHARRAGFIAGRAIIVVHPRTASFAG